MNNSHNEEFDNTNIDKYAIHVVGDSHVKEEIWNDVCNIDNVTSYPGFKTNDIMNMESMILENKSNILLIAGTNDCLSLMETLDLFMDIQKEYDYNFYFVLPFNLTDSYKYYGKNITSDIKLIVFEHYKLYLSTDNVHLTHEGYTKFVQYINDTYFNIKS